jgi:GNAT superfamily N-acetyltransferase
MLSADGKDIAVQSQKRTSDTASSLTIHALSADDQAEVLAFLCERPVHTVFMAGFIRDNGLVSDFNRGTFYGCRDRTGKLQGVALIGHATLVEARPGAMAAFAQLAQCSTSTHMILGERDKVARFWNHYSNSGQTPRRICRELLFELRQPLPLREPVAGLRVASPDDLEILLPMYGQMVSSESGINPAEVDSEGFRKRWLRRVEQGRVWVWIEDGRLIFNADIMCDTPDCIYLEGIYVDPTERGKGYGLRCLSQLSRSLLQRTKSLCLLLNEQRQEAQAFYEKAGFTLCGYYDTIFLHLKN